MTQKLTVSIGMLFNEKKWFRAGPPLQLDVFDFLMNKTDKI